MAMAITITVIRVLILCLSIHMSSMIIRLLDSNATLASIDLAFDALGRQESQLPKPPLQHARRIEK